MNSLSKPLGTSPTITEGAYVAQAFRPARATSGLARFLVTAALVVLGGSATVLACPMCFGAEESSLIDGAKLGILVMMGITFSVQGAFVGFFLYLRRRAKRIADADLESEWAELQRGSRAT